MSLLTIIVDFCERTGLPVPSSVMAATDAQVIQLRGLLKEEGQDLSKRGDWEAMRCEQTFTTIAAEDQGAMTSLTTRSFRRIINQTIWSRDRKTPVAGPLDPRQWQALKALFVNGPYYRFRIRGGRLLVNPTPPAGETWAFEYLTRSWILGVDGVYKEAFTLDTDTLLIPEELALMGLRWRWKKEKGLDYAEDFRTYEMQVKDMIGWDGGKAVLRMDEAQRDATPGAFIPQGSWSL